jgi:hypothetical protein
MIEGNGENEISPPGILHPEEDAYDEEMTPPGIDQEPLG